MTSRTSAVPFALLTAASVAAQFGQDPAVRHPGALERDPFFGKLELHAVLDHPPFAFLVQVPESSDAGHAQRVIDQYLDSLRTVRMAFVREFAEPIGLPREPSYGSFALVILTRGSFIDYARAIDRPQVAESRAYYDPASRLVVTWEEEFPEVGRSNQRKAILHEFVNAVQHAYMGRGGSRPRPLWFSEGLAAYLAGLGEGEEARGTPPMDESDLELLIDVLLYEDHGHVLNRIHDLVTVEGYNGVARNLSRRAQGRLALVSLSRPAFRAQSSLFVRFLHTAADRRYRPALLKYTGEVMDDRSGWSAFTYAFDGFDPGQIETEFFAWVMDEFRERRPGQILPEPSIDLPTVGEAAEAANSGNDADLPADNSAQRVELEFASDEWRLRLAAAIGLVARGRLRDAESLLAEAAEDPDHGSRIAMERERVSALRELRGRIFDLAKQDRRTLEVTVGDDTVQGRVAEVNDTLLVLERGDNRTSHRLSAIGADEIARLGRVLRLVRGDDAWLDLYAGLVTGNSPRALFSRLLRGTDERSRALASAREEYETLRQLSTAPTLFSLLGSLAGDPDGAEDVLRVLGEIADGHLQDPLFAGRRDVLEVLARKSLEEAFNPEDAASFGLHGRLTEPRSGFVGVEYDFSDPGQLRDFLDSPDEARTLGEAHAEIVVPEANGVRILDGNLVCQGSALRRFKVPVQAPFTVRFRVRFPAGAGHLQLGICDDGRGRSQIVVTPFGELLVADGATGTIERRDATIAELMLGQWYGYEIHHSGTEVNVAVDGENVSHIADVATLTAGHVTVFIHSEHAIQFDDLSIEGPLHTEGLASLRQQLISERLAALLPK